MLCRVFALVVLASIVTTVQTVYGNRRLEAAFRSFEVRRRMVAP